MKEGLLLSGGVDSYCAYLFLDKPECIYISTGAKYSFNEYLAVSKLRAHNKDMKLTRDFSLNLAQFEEPDANIPFRNLLLATIAAEYFDKIYIVCQKGEQSIPDRTDKFFADASKLLSYLKGKSVEIANVFADKTKQDIIAWYLSNGYDINVLRDCTWSCFNSLEKRCGECATCFRLWVALRYNNVDVTGWFIKDVREWSGIPTYIRKMQAGKYEASRASQTLEVLKKEGLL